MKSTPVVTLFSVAHFAHHLPTGLLVPLLPLLREDLGANYFQAGILVSAFSLAYGLGQLPMGLLADRFGSRSLIVLGLVGTALAAMAVGLASAYWQMILCLVALGLLGATYHAPASSFIGQSVPPDQRGRSLGTHVVGGSASFLLTPTAAVYIAAWSGTWRLSFLLLAIPTLAMAPLLWLATRKLTAGEDRDRTRQTAQGTQLTQSAVQANPDSRAAAARQPAITWRQILRAIGVLVLMSILMQMAFSSVYAYLPLYLTDRHRISPEHAGIAVGLVAGAGVVGAPLGGAVSDRVGREQAILLFLGLAGPLLFAATRAPAGIWLLVALAAYGVSLSARMPIMESLVADTVPPRQRATFLGAYYLAAQATAGVITPLVGRLIDLVGLGPVFTGLATGLSIVSLIALAIRTRVRAAPLGN